MSITAVGGFLFGFDTTVISGVEQTPPTTLVAHTFPTRTNGLRRLNRHGHWFHVWWPPRRLPWTQEEVVLDCTIPLLLSALGTALAHDWSLFLVFRFLVGLGVGGSSVTASIYITEITFTNGLYKQPQGIKS